MENLHKTIIMCKEMSAGDLMQLQSKISEFIYLRAVQDQFDALQKRDLLTLLEENSYPHFYLTHDKQNNILKI